MVESPDKRPKANGKGGDRAAGDGSGSPYCKIHRSSDHDIQDCGQVEYLAEKQKKEYEQRNKRKAKGVVRGFKKKDSKQDERPARGRDKWSEDDVEDEEEVEAIEFQKAEAMAWVHREHLLTSLTRSLRSSLAK